MSVANKIANKHYEEAGRLTTRVTSHHGPSKKAREIKRSTNRRAKRVEARIAFEDQS